MQGEVAAEFGDLWGEGGGGVSCGAQGEVGDAAPGGAVVGGVGVAGADMPTAGGGDVGGGEFLWVEADGTVVGAGVPVDAVAAVTAAA